MKKYLLFLLAISLGLVANAQSDKQYHKVTATMKSGEKIAYLTDDLDSITFAYYESAQVGLKQRYATSSSVAVDFELQPNCSKFYAACLPAGKVLSDDEIKDYLLENKTVESDASYVKDFTELESEKDYIVYALAFDSNEIPSGVSKLNVRTGKVADDLLRIEIIETTPTTVTYKVVPNNFSGKYEALCSGYEKYIEDCNAESNGGDVINHFIAYWQWLASMYPGETWQSIMDRQLYTGEQSITGTRLRWNSKQMIVAFGMDADGNPTTPVYTKTANTPAAKPTTNQITLTLSDLGARTVTLNAKTTNDEGYVLAVEGEAYVNAFKGDYKAMAEDFCYQVDVNPLVVNGDSSKTFPNRKPGRKYFAFAIPIDEGAPAGEPIVIPFTTPAE
ncbi:hypothetical protein [Prevotella dentasini]|uniref:hypothetical protein n=1 Tax=Prevotella dentasini TaxID=589537 RepID=UPI0004684488|nr:hypothetical protein [Prevotella dentasini]